MTTPDQRLQNFAEATYFRAGDLGIRTGVYEDFEFLPDMSKLVVRVFPAWPMNREAPLFEHHERFPSGSSVHRFIDRPTAAGLMAWKMNTPDEG